MSIDSTTAAQTAKSETLSVPPISSTPWLILIGGGLMLAAQAAFIAMMIWVILERERATGQEQLQLTANVSTSAHSKSLETWAGILLSTGQEITQSPLLADFAARTSEIETPEELSKLLSTALPPAQSELDALVVYTPFTGAYVLSTQGAVLSASGKPARPTDAIRDQVAALVARADHRPLVQIHNLDGQLFLAVYAVFQDAQPGKPTGAIVGLAPIDNQLLPNSVTGVQSVTLYQRELTGYTVISGDGSMETFVPKPGANGDAPGRNGFYKDQAGQDFLATTRNIPGTPWIIRIDLSASKSIDIPTFLGRKEYVIVLACLLLVDILLLLFLVRRFRIQRDEYQRGHVYLARRLQTRQELFEAIAKSINGIVGVKDLKGRYTYVNKGFADYLNRDEDQITGLDDEALFPPDTARVLQNLAEEAKATAQPISVLEDIVRDNRVEHVQLSALALRDAEKKSLGVIMVAQDVTRSIDLARQRETGLRETISALAGTVGLTDPYLTGHAEKVAEMSISVGRLLAVEEVEVSALETGAVLSQIGKLAIPPDILTKEGRLTPAEFEIMKTHILHALRVVEDIDFQSPVQEALSQMYERMDGSGYPQNLKSGEIGILGRILGTVDVFVARTSPRGYRAAITAREAHRVLEERPDRYDPMVVDAIRIVAGL